MDQLLNELQTLDAYNFKYNRCLNNYSNNNKFLEAVVHKKIDKVLVLLDYLLINESGGCNYDNIEILNKNGYDLRAGEKDRFGWLTGILQTTKGYIVYG